MLPTPMILGCGLIDDVRKAVTADFKKVGSCILIVGKTRDEMGASLLFRKFGGEKGAVPGVDIPALKRYMDELLKAMDETDTDALRDKIAEIVPTYCEQTRMEEVFA